MPQDPRPKLHTILTLTAAMLLALQVIPSVFNLQPPLGLATAFQSQRDPTVCEAYGVNWTSCGSAFTSNDVYTGSYGTQYARPDGTVSAGSWTAVGAATHHDAINETTPNGDTDYVQIATTTNPTLNVSTTDVFDPVLSTGHVIRFRANASGTGGAERMRMELYQGSTLIASTGNLAITRGSYAAYSYTLSQSEADAITDYTDLRFWFTVQQVGSGEFIRVTQAEFELTDTAVKDTAWRGFGNQLNDTDVINTVEVGVEWYRIGNAPILNVTVSWDGGSTWATNQTATNKSSDDDSLEFLDFTSATAWDYAKLNDTNLRVRVGTNASIARLDYVTMRIDFTATNYAPVVSNFRIEVGPVAFDAASNESVSAAASTMKWNHTTGSRDDRLLVVAVYLGQGSGATVVSSVKYGSTDMTYLRNDTNSGYIRTEFWYLVAPSAGRFEINVTLSASEVFGAGAASFSGVNQTSPIGDHDGVTANSNTVSLSITSATDDMVIDVLGALLITTLTEDSEQTKRWDSVAGSEPNTAAGAGSTEPGAASVTVGWTVTPVRQSALSVANIRSSERSVAGLQLDVDVFYYFIFNVTDDNKWVDIANYGNVSLRLWYDGNVTPELTFSEQTTGANYRIEVKYQDTGDPDTASPGEWTVVEGRATYDSSISNLTSIMSGSKIVGYEFRLAIKLHYQVKHAVDPTNGTTGAYNDVDSWNTEIVARDGYETTTLQTASTGEHMEFGVYMYTFVNISANWAVTLLQGQTGNTNAVTVYHRSNDDFNMTIWFVTHLEKGSDTIDISNVQILAAADPNDNITTDTAFAGIGEANAIYILGTASWYFTHSTDSDEATTSVQFSVTIPGTSPLGTYTAQLTVKLVQRPP